MDSKIKKISIVSYFYPVFMSPSILNMINGFLQDGIKVDLYLEQKIFSEIDIKHENFEIFYMNNSLYGKTNGVSSYKRSFFYNFLKKLKVLIDVKLFVNNLLNIKKFNHYNEYIKSKIDLSSDIFIGIDKGAIPIFELKKKHKRIRFVYFSLEMTKLNELTSFYEIYFKKKEIKSIEFADIFIIQSKSRLKIALVDNPKIKNVFFLPVTSVGKNDTNKNRYLRDKFAISSDKIIVLYAGALASWTLIDIICREVVNWNDRFVLVIHSPSHSESSIEKNIKTLQEYNRKIFLNTEVLSFDEIDSKIYSGGDIGLAFYDSINSNFETVAYSSGKLASYLKCSLPVITSRQQDFVELFHEEKCGIATNIKDIASSLNIIISQYDDFQKNAINTYNKHYKYEQYHENLLKVLEGLS